MLKDMDFYQLQGNIKKIIGYRIRCCKNYFQKSRWIFRRKIADAVTKSKDDKTVKQEYVEEIIITPEKKDEILNKLRKLL